MDLRDTNYLNRLNRMMTMGVKSRKLDMYYVSEGKGFR